MINYEVASSCDPQNYSTIWTGMGNLYAPIGCIKFQKFRKKGPHEQNLRIILNILIAL